MTQEALRMAHKALIGLSIKHGEMTDEGINAIAAIKEALAKEKALQALHSENERLGLYKEAYAQSEQEPVAWMLTDKNINLLQVDSIQRLIDRLKHAHHTDLCVRINGQDEWFQADWLKHMVRVTPPQRTEPASESANSKQNLERLIRIMGTFDLATGHADTFDELLDSLESELRDVLGYYRQQRTWVGLTPEEFHEACWESYVDPVTGECSTGDREYAVRWTEAKLKEKNT